MAGEALNEAAAIEKAAAEFKVPANRLMPPFWGFALMPLAPDVSYHWDSLTTG
jgi:hypothetical protein